MQASTEANECLLVFKTQEEERGKIVQVGFMIWFISHHNKYETLDILELRQFVSD